MRHPLRKIRQDANQDVASLGAEFETLSIDFGCSLTLMERLNWAILIQVFLLRSGRQYTVLTEYNCPIQNHVMNEWITLPSD